MLSTAEKGIRWGMSQAIRLNEYDKNDESSHPKDWNVDNSYGWTMSQKLPGHDFEWIGDNSKFSKDFRMKKVNIYFIEVDIQYPEKLRVLHNDLRLLSERMKIEKVEKLVTNLHDKTEYILFTEEI